MIFKARSSLNAHNPLLLSAWGPHSGCTAFSLFLQQPETLPPQAFGLAARSSPCVCVVHSFQNLFMMSPFLTLLFKNSSLFPTQNIFLNFLAFFLSFPADSKNCCSQQHDDWQTFLAQQPYPVVAYFIQRFIRKSISILFVLYLIVLKIF